MVNLIPKSRQRMKMLLLLLVLLVPGGAALAASRPVVMELFTSNGCSSCPPAYTLLSKLRANPPADDVQLILLNEHVDYWNDLGWVDPFSAAQFTQRQRGYAHAVFGANSVYTPQLVVNGRQDMVGSRRNEVTAAIRSQAGDVNVPVTLDVANAGSHALNVAINVDSHAAASGPVQVWLALTQDNVVSKVSAGENGGRSLHEDGVVRRMVPANAQDSGQTSQRYAARIDLPAQAPLSDLSLVAFVQKMPSRAIVGATRQPLGKLSLLRRDHSKTLALASTDTP